MVSVHGSETLTKTPGFEQPHTRPLQTRTVLPPRDPGFTDSPPLYVFSFILYSFRWSLITYLKLALMRNSQACLECMYGFFFTPELQVYTTKPEKFCYYLGVSYMDIMHRDQIHLLFPPPVSSHPPTIAPSQFHILFKKQNKNKQTTTKEQP